jgi:hypothetical protein
MDRKLASALIGFVTGPRTGSSPRLPRFSDPFCSSSATRRLPATLKERSARDRTGFVLAGVTSSMEHSDVPPDTVGVDLVDGGVVVEYTDGREVFYRGVPERVQAPHQTAPGKEVHVLVTDETERHGVLVYVNERRSDDNILASSGVGRVMLDDGETSTLFTGVTVNGGRLRCEIHLERTLVDGRVFVFEEDQFEERSYEVV